MLLGVVALSSACAAQRTHTTTPSTGSEGPPLAATACTPGEIEPCPCAAGKGYRKCDAGTLGPCVCTRRDKPARSDARSTTAVDPNAAPADVKSPPPDAVRTSSGLAYKVLAKGTGTVRPQATTRVTVHYTGWTTDGQMFDSSRARGRPATFALNHLIPGWTEGLQLMVAGDRYRFWIPERLAYKGSPNRPQGMLVFDVELIHVH